MTGVGGEVRPIEVAVKPDTGDLKWYYQPVPGDSWDYDRVQGFILADLTINGRQRKTIMQANKECSENIVDSLISLLPSSGVRCDRTVGITSPHIATNRVERLALAKSGADVVDMGELRHLECCGAGVPAAVLGRPRLSGGWRLYRPMNTTI